ncbi:signal peptidase complex catalytic subunit SEC11C [Cyclospora cayetanensis]|uniref:Signal peptidase complex catalytic subunit SEC11C n=2 Tax=Cyclospora cayetanensis TaxID=88456 RepID=A0A6P5WDC2_9EIME|nr:signal peptidase complex catalytic subunit SEC11C [Cyclospora cayetanensis]OEH77228.1 signal peptidase containing protein [Cyclospora cayetanensis]
MLGEVTKFGCSIWEEVKHLCRRPRDACQTVLSICCVILAALMLWKVLVLAAGSPSPVVVVLSGSMLPAFSRGDILFLLDRGQSTAVGDIVVFKVEGREIPIVHRVISLHTNASGESNMLTKGDNNSVDDRGLYANKDLWLKDSSIMGTTVVYLPYVGQVTIVLNDYPVVKWAVIGGMVILALLGYE